MRPQNALSNFIYCHDSKQTGFYIHFCLATRECTQIPVIESKLQYFSFGRGKDYHLKNDYPITLLYYIVVYI